MCLSTTHIFSAAYNATDSYINVPIAKQYKINEIQFGLSNAYNGSAAVQGTDSDRYEMDFKSVFSINNQNQVALNLVNSDKFILHYQHTITPTFKPYQLAVGLRNITESSFTTWNDGKYVQDVNMSPYVVNTFYKDRTSFSIGYGIRAFNHDVKTLQGIVSFIENLNGVFFGFGYEGEVLSFMGEYDGRDINLGVKIKPTDYYEINIGLTEQFISGDYNPQHDNAPRRQITFGISSRNLFSHNDHFNKQIRDLNLKIAQLEQEELKRINEQKKDIEVTLVSEDDVLNSKVADLYSSALIKYNNRNYGGAIKDLQEALKLDPNNVTILTRLGSVYYTYGFLDHAAFYWNKAIEINPNLPELAQIKEFLAKY
tara:strand:+ start:90 stop:1199 length:1110 start_codon:yes stop_codon:yes gene_type:complete